MFESLSSRTLSDSAVSLFLSLPRRLKRLWELSHPAVRVEVKTVHPDAKLPTRAYRDDAASDLYCVEEVVIPPGETANIETGVIFAVPPGYYVTVNGRSSLNRKGLVLTRGIIDTGYTGTMMVGIYNSRSEPYVFKKGDRVGQITLHRRLDYDSVLVEQFSPEYSIRGTRGFGSSGK